MEEKRMRGVHSAVDEIRRNVFTEVARLAYEGGDLKRVDMIPYTIVPGEVARHRHDVFLERAIVQERVRLALGMSLQPPDPDYGQLPGLPVPSLHECVPQGCHLSGQGQALPH